MAPWHFCKLCNLKNKIQTNNLNDNKITLKPVYFLSILSIDLITKDPRETQSS